MFHSHDPELEFGNPRRLAADSTLTNQEKLAILESWQLDLIEMLRAEEENMPSTGSEPGATAKKLAEVGRAIAEITGRMNSRDRRAATPSESRGDGTPE